MRFLFLFLPPLFSSVLSFVGFFFFGWDAFLFLSFHWMESLVRGGIALLRIQKKDIDPIEKKQYLDLNLTTGIKTIPEAFALLCFTAVIPVGFFISNFSNYNNTILLTFLLSFATNQLLSLVFPPLPSQKGSIAQEVNEVNYHFSVLYIFIIVLGIMFRFGLPATPKNYFIFAGFFVFLKIIADALFRYVSTPKNHMRN